MELTMSKPGGLIPLYPPFRSRSDGMIPRLNCFETTSICGSQHSLLLRHKGDKSARDILNRQFLADAVETIFATQCLNLAILTLLSFRTQVDAGNGNSTICKGIASGPYVGFCIPNDDQSLVGACQVMD
jgi:hypothetical protein